MSAYFEGYAVRTRVVYRLILVFFLRWFLPWNFKSSSPLLRREAITSRKSKRRMPYPIHAGENDVWCLTTCVIRIVVWDIWYTCTCCKTNCDSVCCINPNPNPCTGYAICLGKGTLKDLRTNKKKLQVINSNSNPYSFANPGTKSYIDWLRV